MEHRGWGRAWQALRTATAALAAMAVLAAAGCNSSESDSPDNASGKGSSDPGVTKAKAILEQLYKGTYEPWGAFHPPPPGPKGVPGKSVWIISPDQSALYGSYHSAAAVEAAKSLGWKAKIFDAKGTSDGVLNGIRQATVAKADGIVVAYWDCPAGIESGLRAAREAGIVVVGAESRDCEPSQFDWITHYSPGVGSPEYFKHWGAAMAIWDIVKTNGHVRMITFNQTDNQAGLDTIAGIKSTLKMCKDCKVVGEVNFTTPDYGPPLQQKAEQALLAHPDANTIGANSDFVLSSGVAAALRASGRLDEMFIMGGEGYPPNVDLIRRKQGQDAGVGLPLQWEAYMCIDAINRLLQGEKPPSDTGLGLQVFDREHSLPESVDTSRRWTSPSISNSSGRADVPPREAEKQVTDRSTALGIQRVSKAFHGTQALDDVSLEIAAGEIHALLGGNGSGKSTLIKILAGVHEADRGTFVVEGGSTLRELGRASHATRRVCTSSTSSSRPFRGLTVAENIAIGRGFGPAAAGGCAGASSVGVQRACSSASRSPRSRTTRLESLRPSTQTMVAIARALKDQEEPERDPRPRRADRLAAG